MKNYGLISGLQSLLTIQRQISVTHHIQVVKKKKRLSYLMQRKHRTTFNTHSLWKKKWQEKKGTKKNLLNFIAGICKKFTAT